MQRLGYTKHGYGYECQGKAKARRSETQRSNGRALKRKTQYRNGIVTYRGVMRGIVTENSDGQAWHSIGKALRITARTCKGEVL